MKIRASTLANRFYKHDGWTQKLVFELLHTIAGKSPRDEDIRVVEDRKEYYAVYEPWCVFDASKVAQHEYEPYSKSECDQGFESKNTVRVGRTAFNDGLEEAAKECRKYAEVLEQRIDTPEDAIYQYRGGAAALYTIVEKIRALKEPAR